MKKLTLVVLLTFALGTLSGCATFQSDDENQMTYMTPEAKAKARKKKALLTIGGILLAGAVIAHESRDGAKDALRDAARP